MSTVLAVGTGPLAPGASRSPFPGLRPFEPEESELFFGREDDIQDILDRLRRTRFLAIVGSSGCGKSSVVRAGVVASLQDGFMAEASAPWRIALMRPGNNPTAQLAAALWKPGALAGPEAGGPEDVAMAQATLRRGERGLIEEAAEAGLPVGSKVLVLVDQFEELFRFAQKDAHPPAADGATAAAAATQPASTCALDAVDEARAFVKLLLAAADDASSQIYVLLTMRSEFLGDCARFPGLPDAINRGLYLLPQMSREQFRETIVEPVRELHGVISQRLVNRMLNDLGEGADQLPVLQHALMRLWGISGGGREGSPIDLEHYASVGGLQGSISKHAEETYQSLTDAQKGTAEKLFRNITETTADNQKIRRPLQLSRLCSFAGVTEEEVVPVIEKFRAGGRCFLMPPPPEPLTGEKVIDISHESLIRQWGRLKEWAEVEVRETRAYRNLVQNARAWDEEGRKSPGLYTGSRLVAAEEWVAAHPDRLSQTERAFLRASRRRANLRRNLTFIVLLAVVSLTVLALYLVALGQKAKAYREREQAVENAKKEAGLREAADEARKRADEQKALLGDAYRALFTQFGGVISSSISPEDLNARMVESLAANRALQDVPASDEDRARRAGMEVRVFIKGKADEKAVEADIINGALEEKGFPRLSLEPSHAQSAPINSVWTEPRVEDIDAKALAYALIRAGFQIRFVGPYPDPMRIRRRNPTIRAGGDPDIITGKYNILCRPLTVQEIQNAANLSDGLCIKP